ncbi:MAG: hypothetical protein WAM56_21470 [Acidobacteriaceae bacterium]
MSNVFRYTALSYYQMPEAVMESGVLAELSLSALRLYLYLLYRAQKTSSSIVKLTAGDAMKAGLSLRSVLPAREELIGCKLIAATQGRRGFTYELLDPVSGQSLEAIEDLSKVDPEVVGEYFMDHLAGYDPQEKGQGLQAYCPFHMRTSERVHTLHVTFDRGGAFKCNRDWHLSKEGKDINPSCKSGGIIDFEMAMAERNGSPLSKNQAWGQVRSSLLSIMRRKKRQEAEELAERRAML